MSSLHQEHHRAIRVRYGEQQAIFPVRLNDGRVVWMSARDDYAWDDAYIVWCDPKRLDRLWYHHGDLHQRVGPPDRWSEQQRNLVERCFHGSTAEDAIPVALANVCYLHRYPWDSPMARIFEQFGLHRHTISLRFGFTDGCHRTAWLLSRKAEYIPIMTTSLASCWALDQHAGADISTIRLSGIESRTR